MAGLLTNADWTQCLREWKIRLGLSDWKITLVFDATMEEIMNINGGEPACGVTQWLTNDKSAYIAILDSEEYPDGKYLRDFDPEQALVHELLHCKYSMLWDNMERTEQYFMLDWCHQQLDDMARALVEAKRSGMENNANKTNRRGTKK